MIECIYFLYFDNYIHKALLNYNVEASHCEMIRTFPILGDVLPQVITPSDFILRQCHMPSGIMTINHRFIFILDQIFLHIFRRVEF